VNVEPDPEVATLLAPSHEGTLSYVRRPVGKTTGRIHSYFSFLGDSAGVELVAEAQRAYVARALAGTENARLPILSADRTIGISGSLIMNDPRTDRPSNGPGR
jgi:2',3'-cyclic-nucleotide 2'-phosphodiesterase/3'-nucleotidase